MAQTIQVIDVNTTIGAHPRHRLDMSIDRLIRDMDRLRIAASLSLATIGVFHDHNRGNALTLEASKVNNRVVPIATLNPVKFFGTAEAIQAIRSQGFRIFKFFPDDQKWAIDSAVFGNILNQIAPLKVPIMINATNPGSPTAVARMASEYPSPVILCSVTSETLSETLAVMEASPNIMVETHSLSAPGTIEMIIARVGAERIMFGSGAPRRSVAASIQYVLNSEMTEEQKQRILGGNIRQILEAV